MRACILTENEEAISDLRAKEEKKKKMEEKKKAVKKNPQRPRQTVPNTEDSSDEDDPGVVLQLDDSSDFSEGEEAPVEGPYPFVDKELEVRDFIYPTVAT